MLSFKLSEFKMPFFRTIKLTIIAGIMSLMIGVPSLSIAQIDSGNIIEKAPIVVDGNILFKVGKVNHFTAIQRAEIINQTLADIINFSQFPELRVLLENKQTIIRNTTDEKLILTVTQADIISGTSIHEQAQIWRNILQNALIRGLKERTPAYRQRHLLGLGIAIILALTFNLIMGWLAKIWTGKIKRLLQNPDLPIYNLETPVKIVWYFLVFSLQAIAWILILFYITFHFPLARSWQYQVYKALDDNIIKLGNSQYSTLDLLWLLILTIGLWFLIRCLTLLFKQYILKQSGINKGLQDIITTFGQYILTFISLIILWQIWGFDVSSLAIFASVLGVGIGFGLQNIANNFLSGIVIALEGPIQVGDLIKVGDLVGKVQRIGSRSTVIRTLDHVSIIIPNSHFLENDVINWNYDDPISRLRIPIGVAYRSPIRKVRSALLEAVKRHPDVMLTPRPEIWFESFGDSSLNFEVLVWITEPAKQFKIKSELNYRIEASLRHYQIDIPFTQRDVNIRSPQLEQLTQAWLQQQGITLNSSSKDATSLSEEMAIIEEAENDNIFSYMDDKFSDLELENLIREMRGKQGIEIKDRRYRLNLYSTCFVGRELVNWLVENYQLIREEAIELGQILIEKKMIHHVTDQHAFKDDYLFYRFYADEL